MENGSKHCTEQANLLAGDQGNVCMHACLAQEALQGWAIKLNPERIKLSEQAGLKSEHTLQ